MRTQFGDSPQYSYGKRERLRRAGLWRVDTAEYYRPGNLLVVKGDLLQVVGLDRASDWSVVRIYPCFMCLIGPS